MNTSEQLIYKMHEPGDDTLYPTQEVRLELADLIDQLCKETNIKYTLIYTTLMGGVKKQGFLPNIFYFQIGMFYEDMLRFKKVFSRKYADSEYYILDYSNFKKFNKMSTLIMKKGTVRLSPERKDDEKYYDLGVEIIPIFSAGNTKEEYEEFVETANYLMQLVNTRGVVYNLLSTRTKIKNAKYWKNRRRLASLKSENDFVNLVSHLTQYENKSTHYVYLPILRNQEACVCERETYQDVTKILFEDHEFLAIKKRDEWINQFYTEKRITFFTKNNNSFHVFNAYGWQLLRTVQEISNDLLREMDRICRKHGIKYYIMFGSLVGAVRHKGFVPWDDDIDVVMMYDDFCKFREVVVGELDPEKYFFKTPQTDKHCNVTFACLARVGAERTKEEREMVDTNMGVSVDIACMFPGNELRIIEIIQDRLCRFFKTMMWAHLGADEYKRKHSIKKIYYKLLQKVSNRTAYNMFFKIGAFNKNSNTNKLLCPYTLGLFYRHGDGLTDKNNYGEPIDLEFEGMKVMAPQNYHEILQKIYGDYLDYPIYEYRLPKHMEERTVYDFSKMK